MEKFAVLAALALRREGWEVDLLTDWALPKRRLERAFGLSLDGLRIRRLGPWPACGRTLVPMTARYDLFINNASSHSFPSFARESWLWAHYLPKRDPRYLEFYRLFANSHHTRRGMLKLWNKKARVLYGPVALENLRPLAKEKLILSTCRLNSLSIAKNELGLIKLFSRLHRQGKLPGWSYHIAGVFNSPDESWLGKMEAEAAGAPVHIHLNPSFESLKRLYGKASLFWSGTGAQASAETQPKLMEHFGIAIVEAMAAGCIPLAFDGGGPKEIIRDGKSGFLYRTWEELAQKTILAARQESRRLEALRARARSSAARFSVERFREELKTLLPP
jgi:glycosyltransferase involved in cell wall biosynthesis